MNAVKVDLLFIRAILNGMSLVKSFQTIPEFFFLHIILRELQRANFWGILGHPSKPPDSSAIVSQFQQNRSNPNFVVKTPNATVQKLEFNY